MNNFYLLELRNPKKQVLLVVSTLSKIHALTQRLGWDFSILQEVSSVVTDGTNMTMQWKEGWAMGIARKAKAATSS